MMVLVGSCLIASFDDAVDLRRDTFAAESTNAVVSKLSGLVQLESEDILLAKLLLTFSILFLSSAVPHRHLPQLEFQVHPPCSSPRFAFLCCS